MKPPVALPAPPTTVRRGPPDVAVIGAGVAGSACAGALLRAGIGVTVFEKSTGVGGRMATRRANWVDAGGSARTAEFDHGCLSFTATRPRFRAVIERAEALGCVTRWQQRVHAPFPAARHAQAVLPTPTMPTFCRYLMTGVALRLGHAVTALRYDADGWWLELADGCVEGPFAHVVLAIPPAQAAVLLKGHQPDWADALAVTRMAPCWTLMAVTDDLDWPWDVAELDSGLLARVSRQDRKPLRAAPAGFAPWVAEATPAWSLEHLEDDALRVAESLRAALGKLLPNTRALHWYHTSAHRWRYARATRPVAEGLDCWWRAKAGIGVCGDAFGDGSVEAAWRSGDELADAIAAEFDTATLPSRAPTPEMADADC